MTSPHAPNWSEEWDESTTALPVPAAQPAEASPGHRRGSRVGVSEHTVVLGKSFAPVVHHHHHHYLTDDEAVEKKVQKQLKKKEEEEVEPEHQPVMEFDDLAVKVATMAGDEDAGGDDEADDMPLDLGLGVDGLIEHLAKQRKVRGTTAKLIWDLFNSMLVFFCCLAFPFRLAFRPHITAGWWVVFIVVDVMFILDLMLHFVFPYRLPDGGIEVKRRNIAKLYFRSWFLVDFLSSVPWDVIAYNSTDGDDSTALGFLRLMRLVRFMHLNTKLRAWEVKWSLNTAYLGFAKLGVSVILWLHLFACAWYEIARLEDFGDHTWAASQTVRPSLTMGNSTVEAEATYYTAYVTSMYWTVTTFTTVGYGDISPGNNSERIFAMVTMLFAMVLISYLTGSIVSFIQNLDASYYELQAKLDAVRAYLSQRNVPRKLGKLILQHYRYAEDATLGDTEVLAQEFGLLGEVNNYRFTTEVVQNLRTDTVPAGYFIVREGDRANRLYILTKGRALVRKGTLELKELIGGNLFGESALFNKNAKRGADVVAMTPCNLLYLERSDLKRLLKAYGLEELSADYAARKLGSYQQAAETRKASVMPGPGGRRRWRRKSKANNGSDGVVKADKAREDGSGSDGGGGGGGEAMVLREEDEDEGLGGASEAKALGEEGFEEEEGALGDAFDSEDIPMQ